VKPAMFMILVLGMANHCRRRGDFQKRCGVVNSVANELDAATGKGWTILYISG
jgi:hypothetical protein